LIAGFSDFAEIGVLHHFLLNNVSFDAIFGNIG